MIVAFGRAAPVSPFGSRGDGGRKMRMARWPALVAFAVLVALAAAAGAGMLLYPAPPAAAQATVDYDLDNDGLIDVDSLDQLNAIRWDLGGNGNPAAANASSYAAAFPNRITATATRMGCPSGACAGYELTADLDFDANGDGMVTSTDPYPNWTPIGGNYNSTFDGDGHTISNLLMNNSDNQAGLFRGLAAGWPNWSGRPTAPIAMDSRS